MEIRFGAPLRTRDGAQIGSIQRVVLEFETQRFRALTVRIGHIFARERVIGAGLLGPDDNDRRPVANLSIAEVSLLPILSDTHLDDSSGSRDRVLPYSAWTGGEMAITSYEGGSAAVNRRSMPSFNEPEPEADRDVTLVDADTTVNGYDGSKIGRVSAVVCDQSGTAIGLLLRPAGLFQHREVYVPTDLASFSGLTANVLGLEWKE